MAQKTNEFYNIPPDFLSGVFIVPFNFDDPENPEHAKYVNEQTKYDLFYDAYDKVMNIEKRYLRNDNDYFRLKKIAECKAGESFIERFLTKRHVSSEDDNLLRCEDWTIERNGEFEEEYRVKSYQSNTDRFFTLVLPRKLGRFFYLYWTRGGPL